MTTYPYDAEIDVQRLRIDEENPRLPDGSFSQREALVRLGEDQGRNLVALAEHIAVHGLNRAQRFIVAPDGDEFVVLDGNRRLTAIRALESPAAFPSIKTAAAKRLNGLADRYGAPETVGCVVYRDREHADPWVQLTHLDQVGGVGLAKWSAQQKARHDRRRGRKSQPIAVLDFVRSNADLSGAATALIDAGKFQVTQLARMLDTREARRQMGLERTPEGLRTRYPREQILPGLTQLVEDIASRKFNSRDHNKVPERLEYLKSIPLPDPATMGSDLVPIDDAPSGSTPATAAGATKKPRSKPDASKRPFAVPAGFAITIGHDRVQSIFLELRGKLRIEDVPNATGAALRMFLEMSIDDYLERNKLGKQSTDWLKVKTRAVLDHMKATGVLTSKQADKVYTSIHESSTGFTTLHAVVHDREFPVTAPELRAIWSRLERFFLALWA